MNKKVKTKNSCGLCCTQIKNFSVKRGGTQILSDVNLHIHCGELTAIIGPNGAGKSTLLKAVIGDVPHNGELVFVHEKDHSSKPIIGYVPQQLNFDYGSPTSVLDLLCAAGGNTPVWFKHNKKHALRAAEILSKVQSKDLINKRLGDLSGGELQRILLALALDPVPDILLLDEPVSGIDQKGTELFYNIVSQLRKEYDMSIILVSHDLPLVYEYADRVVFLNKTVILCGPPKEVFENNQVKEVFGTMWTNYMPDLKKED